MQRSVLQYIHGVPVLHRARPIKHRCLESEVKCLVTAHVVLEPLLTQWRYGSVLCV